MSMGITAAGVVLAAMFLWLVTHVSGSYSNEIAREMDLIPGVHATVNGHEPK